MRCIGARESRRRSYYVDLFEPNDSLYSAELDFDDSPDFIGRKKIKLCDDDVKDLSKSRRRYRVMEKVLLTGVGLAGGNPKDCGISKTMLCDQVNSYRAHAKVDALEKISSSHDFKSYYSL